MKNADLLILSASINLTSSLSCFLSNRGFNVKIADSPEKAKKLFANPKISLILFDFELGDEFAVKAIKTGLPVVFLIAEENKEIISHIYSLGASDFVASPIIGNLLVARINSQLSLAKGNKDIEKANDDLYNFCMPASHDLKAPFTTISLFANLLKEELKDNYNEKLDDIVTTIGSHSLSIKSLIENHYDHAQAESCRRGGFVRHTKNIDLCG